MKEIAFSPFSLSCVCLFSPQAHVRYKLATVPLEPYGPNMDCIATSRPPLASIHTHTHTHTLSLSLSLSLSQQQWDNNHAHRPSSSPARVLILGTSLSLFDLITLSNSRADSNSAIYTTFLCQDTLTAVLALAKLKPSHSKLQSTFTWLREYPQGRPYLINIRSHPTRRAPSATHYAGRDPSGPLMGYIYRTSYL